MKKYKRYEESILTTQQVGVILKKGGIDPIKYKTTPGRFKIPVGVGYSFNNAYNKVTSNEIAFSLVFGPDIPEIKRKDALIKTIKILTDYNIKIKKQDGSNFYIIKEI
jgi:hypothetical protein